MQLLLKPSKLPKLISTNHGLAKLSSLQNLEYTADTGIPEKEAVNMVNAVVAKRCRQSLITACACYRENENDDIMFQLLKLSGLMTALPLPAGSAQADMVATGLQQRATLPERQVLPPQQYP